MPGVGAKRCWIPRRRTPFRFSFVRVRFLAPATWRSRVLGFGQEARQQPFPRAAPTTGAA
eukprot:14797453-Alexandrium_andersonii.AAC.1